MCVCVSGCVKVDRFYRSSTVASWCTRCCTGANVRGRNRMTVRGLRWIFSAKREQTKPPRSLTETCSHDLWYEWAIILRSDTVCSAVTLQWTGSGFWLLLSWTILCCSHILAYETNHYTVINFFRMRADRTFCALWKVTLRGDYDRKVNISLRQ